MIAEDDAALSLFLTKALEMEGHTVRQIGDGVSAIEAIYADAPELLILDLGLPQMDGMDVLRTLEGTVPSMSILVLTGRVNPVEKVECLNLGADDFMNKPFSMQELMARCRAISRRRAGIGMGVLQHAGLHMDRIQRTVSYRGGALDFTVKEFTLLEYLLLNKGRSVSRRELLEKVWQMSPDAGTNVVDVYVNYLRRKLSGVGSMDLIETVRGEGYAVAGKETRGTVKFVPQSLTMNGFARMEVA